MSDDELSGEMISGRVPDEYSPIAFLKPIRKKDENPPDIVDFKWKLEGKNSSRTKFSPRFWKIYTVRRVNLTGNEGKSPLSRIAQRNAIVFEDRHAVK